MADKIIDIETVRHIAVLAHLELTEDEEKDMLEKLGDVLKYMEKLNELDTSDVEETYHSIDLRNVLREDTSTNQTIKREAALQNAPTTDGEYFKVPKIISDKK